MNTRSLLAILEKASSLLILEKEAVSSNHSKLLGISQTKEGLSLLLKNNIHITEVRKVWSNYFSMNSLSEEIVPDNESSSVWGQVMRVRQTLDTLINSLNNILPESKENSVYLKLPPLKSFEDLSKILSSLKKSISLPVSHRDVGGSVLINSVDNGSIWLEIILGTSTAAGLVGSIAWSAAVINKKRQEGKMLEAQVKSMDLSNEQKQIFLNAQKNQIDSLLHAEAEHIVQTNHKKVEPEEIERLKVSINTTAKLINEGFEIHPSLVSSENVSNLFPDFSKLPLIESKIKKLTGGDKSEDAA